MIQYFVPQDKLQAMGFALYQSSPFSIPLFMVLITDIIGLSTHLLIVVHTNDISGFVIKFITNITLLYKNNTRYLILNKFFETISFWD